MMVWTCKPPGEDYRHRQVFLYLERHRGILIKEKVKSRIARNMREEGLHQARGRRRQKSLMVTDISKEYVAKIENLIMDAHTLD
ncbi:hypothetical protein ElyMa_004983700 [Elysia marginata]|uniref:HTH-like domain-containing protein n=1 Tax=Elysia marginata TaxID=1093978 RepID=A0AAV4J6B6_9GAST|nr:hypothetical protein ElyMa_004983700 [Elysia marginata]